MWAWRMLIFRDAVRAADQQQPHYAWRSEIVRRYWLQQLGLVIIDACKTRKKQLFYFILFYFNTFARLHWNKIKHKKQETFILF